MVIDRGNLDNQSNHALSLLCITGTVPTVRALTVQFEKTFPWPSISRLPFLTRPVWGPFKSAFSVSCFSHSFHTHLPCLEASGSRLSDNRLGYVSCSSIILALRGNTRGLESESAAWRSIGLVGRQASRSRLAPVIGSDQQSCCVLIGGSESGGDSWGRACACTRVPRE